MNKWAGTGRLTRDPDIKNTTNGKTVATFTLAVDRRFKNAEGQKEADFIPIVFWGKPAELVGQYLSKGSKIGVTGRISTRNYEGTDGVRRYVTEIIGDELEFLSTNKEKTDSGFPDQLGGYKIDDDFQEIDPDDIPF